MRYGQFNGKGRQPTSNTFRFLAGCVTHAEKKKLLEEFIRKNTVSGFSNAKKSLIQPKKVGKYYVFLLFPQIIEQNDILSSLERSFV